MTKLNPQSKAQCNNIVDELSPRERSLIESALEIEQRDARKVGALGYLARTLIQATLPHSDPKLANGQLYSRSTGRLTVTVAPTSPRHGIPYGTVPRLILAWICTEAVLTRNRTLSLGRSQSDFLKRLQMHSNGRDIGRFRDQSLRLFKSVFSFEYSDAEQSDLSRRLLVSDKSTVFWHPKNDDETSVWNSTLVLSQPFFNEILAAPVPFNMDVYHALSKAPMAMDIYTWLTYRMFILRRSGKPFVLIPWIGLKKQFGAGYANDRQGLFDFKTNFKKRLREVLNFYPEAREAVEYDRNKEFFKLTPCVLHIMHRKSKLRQPD